MPASLHLEDLNSGAESDSLCGMCTVASSFPVMEYRIVYQLVGMWMKF